MAQRELKAGIVLGGRVDGSVNVIGAKLDELAQYLYQKETITGEEFMDILNRDDTENKPENP